MTACGRASLSTPIGSFTAELQSVNRKFLEVGVALPSELAFFESLIKKLVGEVVHRGSVNCKLSVVFKEKTPLAVVPNLALAKQMYAAAQHISHELGQKTNSDTVLSLILSHPNMFLYTTDEHCQEACKEVLESVLKAALEQLMQMKRSEGEVLKQDFLGRLHILRQTLEQIALIAPNAVAKNRQKLINTLEEVLPGRVENEEKILREVCIYAERIDITEEITRFRSHLDQCTALLESSSEEPIGKTMEFLLQELGREVNTVGSKSADIEISKAVIRIKSELEKIREQIQNIE